MRRQLCAPSRVPATHATGPVSSRGKVHLGVLPQRVLSNGNDGAVLDASAANDSAAGSSGRCGGSRVCLAVPRLVLRRLDVVVVGVGVSSTVRRRV
jgi:hypothetical protein